MWFIQLSDGYGGGGLCASRNEIYEDKKQLKNLKVNKSEINSDLSLSRCFSIIPYWWRPITLAVTQVENHHQRIISQILEREWILKNVNVTSNDGGALNERRKKKNFSDIRRIFFLNFLLGWNQVAYMHRRKKAKLPTVIFIRS